MRLVISFVGFEMNEREKDRGKKETRNIVIMKIITVVCKKERKNCAGEQCEMQITIEFNVLQ